MTTVEQKLFDLCTELQNISGKNDKIDFIKQNKDDKDFSLYLSYLLDSMKVYGLQKKKIEKALKNDKLVGEGFDSLLEVFNYLLKNNTGRDLDAHLVASFTSQQPEHLQDWIVASITKTLKLGVTAKSVNKAFGEEFITEFNVMLAHPLEKYESKIKDKEIFVTEKLDGTRATFIYNESGIVGYSRQGKILDGYGHIENELKQLDYGVYDGEVLISNADDFKDRDVMQQTQSIAGSKGDKSSLNFHVFDYVDLDVFKNGKSQLKYSKRREQLDSIDVSNLSSIKIVPLLYHGKDFEIVTDLLNKIESEGKEGLMINLDDYYVTKRSSSVLKMKTFSEFDEKCIDIFEGEGKYTGKLGGIYVNYKGSYKLGIGSGFTDEQREYYWKHPDEIIGKIVSVKYFRESKNKDGGLSVSFPIYRSIRTDKDEPSYN